MSQENNAGVDAAIADPDKVTIRQAAQVTGLPVPTIQGWVNRRLIQKYKRGVGQTVYVSLSEIREKAAIRPVDDDQTEGSETV